MSVKVVFSNAPGLLKRHVGAGLEELLLVLADLQLTGRDRL
jgi:hypothetical protein